MSKKKWLALLLTLVMVFSLVPQTAFADEGDVPESNKLRTSNGNGTYKLELSVTGDAETETQEVGNVNVVIVYDVSQSMTNRVSGNSGPRRADATEKVVHDFLVNLAKYQNSDRSNIQASLVTFAVTATQVQGWTNNINTNNDSLANRFASDGTYNSAKLSYTGLGTNWGHALIRAQALVNSAPLDGPTFVIFFTDGAPTAQGANATSGMSPQNRNWWEFRNYYNAATEEAEDRFSKQNAAHNEAEYGLK